MGVDRHEFEHRNWRWSAAMTRERGSNIDQPDDLTVIPDDVAALAPKPPRKPRKQTSKAKADA